MSLSDHVVDNPEEHDTLFVDKETHEALVEDDINKRTAESKGENDGNTRANEGEDMEDHADQSEEKQEDENILWDGSNHK